MPELSGTIRGLVGNYNKRQCYITPGMVCLVGRRSRSDISVIHERVSRLHCRVELMNDGTFVVTDESMNGTYIDQMKLEKGVSYAAPSGSKILIADGDVVLELRLNGSDNR